MTGRSEIGIHWFGLCRKPPVVHALQTSFSLPPEPVCAGQPDGDRGRSGSLRRGIGSAISGMRTLNRNRQLLWFTLLSGLVLAGTTIGHGVIGCITWNMRPTEAEWVVLNLILEFITLFCLVFLLTGLTLSIPPRKEGPASFFRGVRRAKKYLKSILSWSFLLTLAGMLLFSIYFYSPNWLPRNHPFLTLLGTLFGSILNPLMEFPFNPTFSPYSLFDPSFHRGFSLAFWIYPAGVMQALIFSEINLLFFILTPFVVPFVVLEQKSLREAVTRSFALVKKNLDEVAACVFFLGVVTIGVFFTYLLVQAVSGMISPGTVVTAQPGFAWTAFALLYDAALFCFVILMATVGGIAALDLYTSAKSRENAVKSAEQTGVAA